MTDNHLNPHGLNPVPSHIHVQTRGSTAPTLPRVAILGTGKMGSAIAARLAATGFKVVVWNRTRSRAEALGLGTVAATPAAAAAAADVIVSSLTGRDAVLAAYLGPDGALSAGEGKLFIEMSTAGPDLLSTLAERVAATGGTLVDAPIIGAPPAVRAGEATILAGGFDQDIAVARPLLSAFGTVRHVGSLGSAARLKLVANSMLADVIQAAAELQVAGEGSGRCLLGPAAAGSLTRGAPSRPHRESPYAPALRPARSSKGRRPGVGTLQPVGRLHAADSIGERTGQCGCGVHP